MRRITPMILAASLAVGSALAGCDLSAQDVLPAIKGLNLKSNQQAIASQLISDMVANVQAYTDLDLGTAMVSSPTTASLYGVQRAGFDRGAVKKRMDAMRQRMQEQLAKHRPDMTVVTTSTKSVDIGLETTTTIQLSRGGFKQSQTQVQDVDPTDGSVLRQAGDLSRQYKNGLSYQAHRERVNNDDGSFDVTFHSEIKKGDKSRTVDWTRHGSADGSETGTGVIKRFDGSVVDLTLAKSADGTTVSKTQDDQAKVGVEVDQTDSNTQATAKVTDTASGQVAGTTTVDAETTDPSAE